MRIYVYVANATYAWDFHMGLGKDKFLPNLMWRLLNIFDLAKAAEPSEWTIGLEQRDFYYEENTLANYFNKLQSFYPKTIREWNDLPRIAIIETTDIEDFMSKLSDSSLI